MDDKDTSDSMLKRYDILMQQNRFEHTSFWTRFGFMMISQIGLFGFFINMILDVLKGSDRHYLLLSLPLCFVGMTLVIFFFKLHEITDWWVNRWLKLIESHEQEAFGDTKVVRGGRQEAPGSVRRVAKWFVVLFTFIWYAAAIAIITLVACMK
jgi:hypothetical protein